MADPQHYQFLTGILGQPNARQQWLDFRDKQPWIDLSAADLTGLDLRDFDFSGVNLSTAILLGADLAGTIFTEATLGFADMRRCNLRNATLTNADLTSANLQDACLVDARVDKANLSSARLTNAELTGADLSDADLAEADLREASLKFCQMNGVDLNDADVAQADLTGVTVEDHTIHRTRNLEEATFAPKTYKAYKPMRKRPLTSHRHATPEPEPSPVDTTESTSVFETTAEVDLTTVAGCCQVLGVVENASSEKIVRAFRKRAKMIHPDKVRHLDDATQKKAAEEFQQLHQAYERLTQAHGARPLKNVRWAKGVPRRTSPYEYTVEEYEALLAVNSGNVSIIYNLAWKYFEADRHEEALRGFKRVLAINPDDEDAQYNLMISRLCVELALPEPAAADATQ